MNVIRVVSSVLGSALIVLYAWRRRAAWWSRQTTIGDQLLIVFVALAGANAVLCYAYTKDVILSPAGGARAAAGPNAFTVGISPDERGRVLAKAVLEPKPQAVAIVRDPMAKSANQAADRQRILAVLQARRALLTARHESWIQPKNKKGEGAEKSWPQITGAKSRWTRDLPR